MQEDWEKSLTGRGLDRCQQEAGCVVKDQDACLFLNREKDDVEKAGHLANIKLLVSLITVDPVLI